jgi:hypothetical protein
MKNMAATPLTSQSNPTTMAAQLGPGAGAGGGGGKSYPQWGQTTARWSSGLEHRGQKDMPASFGSGSFAPPGPDEPPGH